MRGCYVPAVLRVFELLVLNVILKTVFVQGHELCRDPNTVIVSDRELSFCSQYSNKSTCCDASRDLEIETLFNATLALADSVPENCSVILKDVLCSRCDAWEDHLFERASLTKDSPTLCSDYCETLYQECKDVILASPPFAPGENVNLTEAFPSVSEFCGTFAPSDASYCFGGEPYEPPPAVVPDSNYTVCVEHLSDYDDDMIGIVPLPQRFDVLVGYTRGGTIRALSAISGRMNQSLGVNGVVGTVTLFCPTPNAFSEQGLLSLVFKPDFAISGLFYVYGNVANGDNGGIDTAIREWQCSDPANLQGCTSGNIVMHVYQPFSNHNGAHMQFAPHDARVLVVALGDGGAGCDPSNRAVAENQILGKVVRIRLPLTGSAADFNYDVPDDNPFSAPSGTRELCGKNLAGQRAGTTKTCQEIWVVGLRNPFRCSIDRFDPEGKFHMYCGDVGQGRAEEVDMIPTHATYDAALQARLPLHYGWDVFEGEQSARLSGGNCGSTTSICPPGFNSTVVEATTSKVMECPLRVELHHDGWRSVIGGYVCRSCNEPVLQNRYVYADYLLKGLAVIDPLNPSTKFTVNTRTCGDSRCHQPEQGVASLEASSNFVWSFAEDNHGLLYLINPDQGLYRVVQPSLCVNGSVTAPPGSSHGNPVAKTGSFIWIAFMTVVVVVAIRT